MRSTLTITFMLFAMTQFALAIDSPSLRCIALDENDDVTLTWSLPSDTGTSFEAYNIYYRSGSSQPFNLISQVVDYSQSSVTIAGSFAGDGAFYIATLADVNQESNPTDTNSPLIVSLFTNGPEATLSWTPFRLSNGNDFYVFRREVGTIDWDTIGMVPDSILTFKDTASRCVQELEYRLVVEGKGGCLSISNSPSAMLTDDVSPLPNALKCASVDTSSGFVNLEWDKSISPDVLGYLVTYYEDFVRFDTIFGLDSLKSVFTTWEINAQLASEELSVAPFDSCWDNLTNWYNQSPIGPRFRTMFIDTLSTDRCLEQISIGWSLPRNNVKVGVRDQHLFRVYRSVNNEEGILLAELSNRDSVYVDNTVAIGEYYTYVVKAVDTILQKEAFSNKLEVRIKPIPAPEVLYLSSIKNDHETGENLVEFVTDSADFVERFRLLRSFDDDIKPQVVSALDNTGREHYSFRDEIADGNNLSYYYTVVAYDDCDAEISRSNTCKSILIEGYKEHKEIVNDLFWTPFIGFDSLGAGIGEYRLYRNVETSGVLPILAKRDVYQHVDSLTFLNHQGGRVCYYVEALEADQNQLEFRDTARSNQVCFDFSPRLFFPNAFSPDNDGINDEFLPYANYVSQADYSLVIFDRTGRIVFESTDPTQGWKGQNQEIGVYVYVLSVQNAYGDPIQYSGKVHLIR